MATDMIDVIYDKIASYYTGTVTRFGATPRGVDWTCQATQEMRFVQLLKLCDLSRPFSLNDLGCGYGALAAFLGRRHPSAQVDYLGIDLSGAMVQRASRRYRGIPDRRFVVGDASPRIADYTLASGVMNVHPEIPQHDWEEFIRRTLSTMRQASRNGFAVNFLDSTLVQTAPDELYHTAPEPWISFCQQRLGCSVQVIRDYGMREFTLLIRPDQPDQASDPTTIPPARKRRPKPRSAPPRKPHARPAPSQPNDALQAAAAALLSPEAHADEQQIHSAFRLLRRSAPAYWVDLPRVKPFWAITRYHDIMEVERKGSGFIVAPRTQLGSEIAEMSIRQISGRDQLIRTLLHMDEPEHTQYRAIAQPWFLPAELGAITGWIANWAKECVDNIAARGGACDFATQVAVPFTLRIITRILGIPPADEPALDRLLQGIVGADDPWRRFAEPPANPVRDALLGCRDYFDALAADRRACPRDDLATAIANATLSGVPLQQFERVSYYTLLAIAGYDTTAFALSGGLHALIEHPDQRALLQRDPAMLDSAIEEILRWTSPSRHFVRTATRDTELAGQPIRAGQAVAIFFPSGNRDEAVFPDADSFRIDRNPNPHMTFGRGAHFCLGHTLARLELRAFLTALLPRLQGAEIAGPTRRSQSVFLTGFTSLPVRIRLS